MDRLTIKRFFSIASAAALLVSCAEGPYDFEGKITDRVLHNYLSHAITMSEFLTVDPFCNDGTYPDKQADIDYILNTGTKFVGRAIYRWGDEDVLANREFLDSARSLAVRIHSADPDIILQAAVFECVTPAVEKLQIPEWTFRALGLPVEKRNFHYSEMLFEDGLYVDHWGEGSVPDIRKVETQLWYMYLIGTYVDLGCEAVHLGQVYLTGFRDHAPGRDWENWDSFLTKARRWTAPRARRGIVLFDCHGGRKGVMVGDRSLIDFNTYPLRMKEVEGEPMRIMMEEGYSDSVYGHHQACITPSGYRTDALPYMVEFDNFGVQPVPGAYSGNGYCVWGYDEISWFYLLPHEEKLAYLDYICEWIEEHDPVGHLQMPGARVVTLRPGSAIVARAVAQSMEIPYGMGIEEKVKDLFTRMEVR